MSTTGFNAAGAGKKAVHVKVSLVLARLAK
jgi:hypothetical protein